MAFVSLVGKSGQGETIDAQIKSLHVIQELLDVFQLSPTEDVDTDEPEPEYVEETVMALSDAKGSEQPVVQNQRRQTMKFRGFIGKLEILILLDSGSVGTFVRDEVVQQCGLKVQQCQSMRFSTANGSPMQSSSIVSPLTWFLQGHTFSYNARVLPPKCYDVILGADWLEDHNPTWIHWKQKIMKFPHIGKQIQLQGLLPSSSACQPIAPKKVQGLLRRQGMV